MHRVWTTITSLPFDDEARWEPVITSLERDHADLGPVISFEADGSAVIILADDAVTLADSARVANDAITPLLPDGSVIRELRAEPANDAS
ncbi:MAG: hypothetical protein Q8O56_03550 [Solirubrobacteraceae bacterium]|nr:hypothetical protein [Solirubrobacteraceae bacterium]